MMSDSAHDFVYSVLIPVYGKDSPEYFKFAVDSMINQTVPPEEIFIAVDGPVGDEMNGIISRYKSSNASLFTVKYFPENRGIAPTLRDSLPMCRNEFVARMDADDYSLPTRIEEQSEIFRKYPKITTVGCNVDEFEGDITNVTAHVILPETPEEARKFARRRSPMRHPAMVFRKSDIIAIGSYRDVYKYEDYDLQARIIHEYTDKGGGVYNVQKMLVMMRVSKDFYARRGGIRLACSSLALKIGFWRDGLISFTDLLVSGLGQAFVALMPGFFREWFYKKFLRH